MSDRTNDIRMYVEHLFEGRTLTPEAIELKEEIYGNLTARYEDYRAQGMSEDEAYARTCEAVTSVDGVLDGEGGEGGAVVGSGATSGAGGSGGSGATGGEDGSGGAGAGGGAGETAVAPCPTGARPGDAPTAPGAPTPGTARGGLRGWKVAVAVAVVVFAVLVWVVAFGVSAGDGRGDSQDVTSAVVQPVGGGADDAAKGPDANAGAGSGGGGAADASPTAAGTSVISTDDVAREVASHDASALAGSVAASWPVESTSVSRLAGDLPLAGFVSSAGTDSNATYGNVVTVEYGWSVDERVARADGDVVESTLAYDAAALLCAVPEADSVQLTVRETDRADGELDVDVYAFRRADVERALGVALTAERLTDGGWGDLRAQLSTERVYDQVVDHAERD